MRTLQVQTERRNRKNASAASGRRRNYNAENRGRRRDSSRYANGGRRTVDYRSQSGYKGGQKDAYARQEYTFDANDYYIDGYYSRNRYGSANSGYGETVPASTARNSRRRSTSRSSRAVGSSRTRALSSSGAATRAAAERNARPSKTLAEYKREKAAAKKTRKSRAVFMGKVFFVFVLACILVYRHTSLLEINQEIGDLQSQYADINTENEAIQSNIDQMIELGNLEDYAINNLGMVKPDSSQIFYVDMNMTDRTVTSRSDARQSQTGDETNADGANTSADAANANEDAANANAGGTSEETSPDTAQAADASQASGASQAEDSGSQAEDSGSE